LLFGKEGSGLRQRLLLTLVRDDRLQTEDLQALMGLMGRTFSPVRLAGDFLARINPLASQAS
jgi:hypothetical protein